MLHSKTVTNKKGKQMVSWYLRGKIIWLNYYVDGKRFQKSTKLKHTQQNLKIVEQKIIPLLQSKIATGEIYKTKPKTFRYYGNIFLESKSNLKTFDFKYKYFQRVINNFGDRNIDEITRLDIKQYLISLNMKNSSKNTYKSCLKGIFELAVDDGVLNNNPAINLTLKGDTKEPIQYYSRDEVKRLLNATYGYFRVYLLIAFNTGLRVGEILGLQLGDFKDDGYIHVQRTRTKGRLGSGKTSNAIRRVPYSSMILDEVKKIVSHNIFLFKDIDDAAGLRYQWNRACKDANVPRHKLYSTRHTFATTMLKENIVSINELAGLLGHSSPKITLQHYASVIDVRNNTLDRDFALFCDDLVTIQNKTKSKSL